jgi:hypothetical protein
VLVVARKNGKSLMASGIGNYMWRVDGGFGAKVFCCAPKLEQADIVYNNIWQMLLLDPEYQALKIELDERDTHNVKVKDQSALPKHRQSDLAIIATNSTVKKIAFSAKKSDGFNPSLAICDEIAAWEGDKGLKQYEVMKSGMGARPEGLLLSCTTSGNGESRAVIQGTRGYMVIEDLKNFSSATVYDSRRNKTATYKRGRIKSEFEFEMAAFAAAMKSGWKECPEIPHAQTLSMMQMMDFIRRQLGISYEDIQISQIPNMIEGTSAAQPFVQEMVTAAQPPVPGSCIRMFSPGRSGYSPSYRHGSPERPHRLRHPPPVHSPFPDG